MIEWTETARQTLDEYCARSRAVLAGTGADADEVVDDLRRHVEEEVRTARLTVVTEEDIRRILARVGEPGSAVEQKQLGGQPGGDSPQAESGKRKRPGFLLLVAGVVLPLVTLIFELMTGISAGVLFDPLPSWFHVAAVALVPATNFWIWQAGRARDPRHARLLGWLNGIALGVCLYYALLYLPFTPIAAVGIIWLGLGLIPLGPYFALLSTPWLRAVYRSRIKAERLPGAWLGAFAALGVLLVLQMPMALTYYGLAKASSDDKAIKAHGVRVLRAFGDHELMLRACYGLLRRELDFDLVRNLASGNRTISADQAREVYYRVTGKPFNSVPPPSLYTRMGRWAVLDEEFTWDDALGGEAVAGRVKGLSLQSSRVDAVAEPDAAVVYCEWTLEFKNISPQQREARAQIALPPGAVVSRLTLWVNGEEREAAFGGRAQVRQAYQEVAVVRRRDPVLVTTCGPDRVMMQCFPVPANGGVMKVRVGITAPLFLESLDRGRFVWPRFLERNFGIAGDFKHALWIESPAQLANGTNAPPAASSGTPPFTLRASLSEIGLAESPQTVVVHRSPAVETVWTPATEDGRIIRQTIRRAVASRPARVVFVVDGSAGMQAFSREIAETLSEVPKEVEIAMLVGSDDPVQLSEKPQPATRPILEEIQRRLRNTQFAGGQDNFPALEAAWDLAAASDNGVVIWIHAPEPVLLSSGDPLRQRFERSARPVRFFELQTRVGPDRVVEKLDGLAVDHVPCFGSLHSDLGGLLAQWEGKGHRYDFVREQVPAAAGGAAGKSAGRHIERLWARDEAVRLAAERRREAAMKLAVEHQLVTPFTGAVVLETIQQFTQHGLTPADPNTVPAVPEPQTWAMIVLGVVALALTRGKRKRRA